MTKPIIRIHDLATNEVIDREMTAAEFKQYEADQKTEAARIAEIKAKQADKLAILDRIGLTADELPTILG